MVSYRLLLLLRGYRAAVDWPTNAGGLTPIVRPPASQVASLHAPHAQLLESTVSTR